VITASVVLYKTPMDQIDRLLDCIKESAILSRLYVVDNSPSPIGHPRFDDPLITYLWMEKNRGYGGGHNVALRIILQSSEFHFVLNPDIHFGHEDLQKMIGFMREKAGIGQLMPKVVYEDGSLQYLCKLIPTPVDLFLRRFASGPLRSLAQRRMDRFELRFTRYNRVMEVPYLSGCFMLIRVSALRSVGLFDERYFMYMEDVDLCRRIGRYYKTVFYPYVSVTHDYAKGSYRSFRLLNYHVQSAIRYFSKWGWFSDPERKALNEKTNTLSPGLRSRIN
jgi:GT2 family glycosyltransferase